jgi:hypothetical protein
VQGLPLPVSFGFPRRLDFVHALAFAYFLHAATSFQFSELNPRDLGFRTP